MLLKWCGRAVSGLSLVVGLLAWCGVGRADDSAEVDPAASLVPSVSADLFAQPAAPAPSTAAPPSPASASPSPGFGARPSLTTAALLSLSPRMIGDPGPRYGFAAAPGTIVSSVGTGTVTITTTTGAIVVGGVVSVQSTMTTTTVPASSLSGPSSSSGASSSSTTTVTRVPTGGGEIFKVSDNQSPAPEDRVFLTFNYFNGVQGPTVATSGLTRPIPGTTTIIPGHTIPGFPIPGDGTTPPTTILPGSVTTSGIPSRVVQLAPSVPAKLDLYHEVFGVEKTFLDGRASIQLQEPLNETSRDLNDQQDGDGFGDLSLILKYALLQNKDAGEVLTAGLAVTFPTGLETRVAVPPPFIGDPVVTEVVHPYQFQPFVGAVYNIGDFYVEGFSSVSVPTDSRDVTLMFNDVGVGYHLYKNEDDEALLRSVTPTFEVHVNTPLNHRNPTDLITVPNSVDLTAGFHLGLGDRTTLTFAADTPVTGPKPYQIEAIAELNWSF